MRRVADLEVPLAELTLCAKKRHSNDLRHPCQWDENDGGDGLRAPKTNYALLDVEVLRIYFIRLL